MEGWGRDEVTQRKTRERVCVCVSVCLCLCLCMCACVCVCVCASLSMPTSASPACGHLCMACTRLLAPSDSAARLPLPSLCRSQTTSLSHAQIERFVPDARKGMREERCVCVRVCLVSVCAYRLFGLLCVSLPPFPLHSRPCPTCHSTRVSLHVNVAPLQPASCEPPCVCVYVCVCVCVCVCVVCTQTTAGLHL